MTRLPPPVIVTGVDDSTGSDGLLMPGVSVADRLQLPGVSIMLRVQVSSMPGLYLFLLHEFVIQFLLFLYYVICVTCLLRGPADG